MMLINVKIYICIDSLTNIPLLITLGHDLSLFFTFLKDEVGRLNHWKLILHNKYHIIVKYYTFIFNTGD